MTPIDSVREMLSRLRDQHQTTPSRSEMVDLLATVEERLSRRMPAPNAVDLGPALRIMNRLGKVRTGSDLGRALKPGVNPEAAANLGNNRLRSMKARGWVVNGELGGWLITDEGRAEAARAAE